METGPFSDDEEADPDDDADEAAVKAALKKTPYSALNEHTLRELPWRFVITKEARAAWANLQDPWK